MTVSGRIALVALLGVISVGPSVASLACPPLQVAIQGADAIVFARVTAVMQSTEGRKLVTLGVLEVWKGKPPKIISLNFSDFHSWGSANPVEGETAVFVLQRGPDYPFFMDACGGRRHLPVVELDSHEFVECYGCDLPTSIPKRSIPVGTEGGIRTLYELRSLKDYIVGLVANPSNTAVQGTALRAAPDGDRSTDKNH